VVGPAQYCDTLDGSASFHKPLRTQSTFRCRRGFGSGTIAAEAPLPHGRPLGSISDPQSGPLNRRGTFPRGCAPLGGARHQSELVCHPGMLVFFVLIGLLVAPSEFIASHGLNGFTEALSEKDTNHIHACSMTLRPRSRFVEKSFPRSPPPIPGHRRRDITAAHRTCRKMPANRRSNASAPTISMSPHVFRSQDHAPDFQRLNPGRCRPAPSHHAPRKNEAIGYGGG
jgi:hypothetical protein